LEVGREVLRSSGWVCERAGTLPLKMRSDRRDKKMTHIKGRKASAVPACSTINMHAHLQFLELWLDPEVGPWKEEIHIAGRRGRLFLFTWFWTPRFAFSYTLLVDFQMIFVAVANEE
jgi:hypothetical protein